MRYIPRLPKDNVNVSTKNPFREFLTLLAGVVGLILIVYIFLGIALDIIIQHYESEVSSALGALFSRTIVEAPEYEAASEKLQGIIDRLASQIPENNTKYSIHIVKDKTINALAYPGGEIVVHSGLVERVQSENEIAMVLAHELGHYMHKDHTKGLGRRLVLFFISALILGEDSGITSFFGNSLRAIHLRFSRDQEIQADEFALDLLNKTYGHAGGATDFFERVKQQEDTVIATVFHSTHPMSKERIALLKEWIIKKRYPVLHKQPFTHHQR